MIGVAAAIGGRTPARCIATDVSPSVVVVISSAAVTAAVVVAIVARRGVVVAVVVVSIGSTGSFAATPAFFSFVVVAVSVSVPAVGSTIVLLVSGASTFVLAAVIPVLAAARSWSCCCLVRHFARLLPFELFVDEFLFG